MRNTKRRIDPDAYLPPELLAEVRKSHSDNCRDTLLKTHISNFLYNVRVVRYYPGILGFEGALKRMPSIIIGAGPSLTPSVINSLKEHRSKVLLFAVDAALPLLKKHDLYPHFCVMVDPTEKQKHNFDDIDTTQFLSIIPPIVHPSIFRIISPNHLAIYNVKDPRSDILELAPYHTGKKGALPAGGLTSGSAFAFAAICGCDPIMFVGHDLSWPTPDKVYAEGINEKKVAFQKGAKFRGKCLLFPDINGGLVLTHETFIVFRAWMRDMVPSMSQRVINCTESGILAMKGMRQMKLERALRTYCSKEMVGVMERIQKAYRYEISDGFVEKLLKPKFRRVKEVRRHGCS